MILSKCVGEPTTQPDCDDLLEKTNTMGHHWVPQHYLKGFAVEGTADRLWQFDKRAKSFSAAPIPAIQVAQQKRYNEQAVENALTNEVENPANPILDKLREGRKITSAEKRVFSQYLGTMLLRVPNSRRVATGMYPEVLSELLSDVSGAIDLMREHGASPLQIALRRAELIDAQQKFEAEMPSEAVEAIKNPFPHEDVIRGLFAMNWYLVKATGTQRYVTSDDPMFVFRCWGIGRQQSEFCFPLSSSMGLFGSRYPTNWWLSYSSTHVAQANERIVSDAGRFIYCSEQSNWIADYCETKPEKLQRLLPP
jgi:hypothetical protein